MEKFFEAGMYCYCQLQLAPCQKITFIKDGRSELWIEYACSNVV